MKKLLIILSFSLAVSVKAQTYNNGYLLNKPAAVFRGLMLLNDTLIAHGYIAESFPFYPVKYIIAKFDLDGNPVIGYSAMLDSFTDYWTQNHFILTKDSCFAFVGVKNTGEGGLFFKTTTQGAILFGKEYTDSTAWSYGFNYLLQLEDSSFLILGSTSSTNLILDLILIKTNSSGNLLWSKKLGTSNLTEMPFGMFQLQNGNILIGAGKGNYAPYQITYSNTYLLEIDTGGTILKSWLDTTNKTYGPTAYLQQPNGDAIYCSIRQDTIISTGGNPTNYASIHKGYIVREDSLHNKLWQLTLGQGSSIPAFFQMKKLSDGKYLAVGGTYDSTYTDGQPYKNTGWLVKFDEDGTIIWQRRYFNTTDMPGQTNYLYDFVELSDGGIVAAGERIDQFTDYPQQGWLLRLDNYGCLIPGCQNVGINETEVSLYDLKIYPNPVSDILYLYFNSANQTEQATYEVKISSIQGNRIEQLPNLQTESTYIINTKNFPQGIYIIQLLKNNQLIKTGKILKQ